MIYKIDPYGFAAELRPGTDSSVNGLSYFKWKDQNWLEKRKETNSMNSPIAIFPVIAR